MIGLKYNKKFGIYELWELITCKCGSHTCKSFVYGSTLDDCLKKIKNDLEIAETTGFQKKGKTP